MDDPCRLDIERVRDRVASGGQSFELRYVPEVDSTNRVVLAFSDAELRHGVTVITDFQSAGRGRLGRHWGASRGSSLLLSVALQLFPGMLTTDVVMAACLSVADAIGAVTSLPATLKWPNDILVRGRKTCGILTETARRGPTTFAVVGIGLNVNSTENDLACFHGTATSLLLETGKLVVREDLLISLLVALDMWYCQLTDNGDFVFRAWRTRLETLGMPVEIHEAGLREYGVARDVQRDGGLLVDTKGGGTRIVYAADVSIRRTEGFTTTE